MLAARGYFWKLTYLLYGLDPIGQFTDAWAYDLPDASGNTLTYLRTQAGQTVTTRYTYDNANELLTAQEDGNPTVWHYTYDHNGALIETTPGISASSGAKRYTYNSAGYLIKVETHNGTSYQPQAEMRYNGNGQRLEMTAYASGQSAYPIRTSYARKGV